MPALVQRLAWYRMRPRRDFGGVSGVELSCCKWLRSYCNRWYRISCFWRSASAFFIYDWVDSRASIHKAVRRLTAKSHEVSRSREIGCYDYRITLKFDRHLDSSAAEMPVKFQSDQKSLNPRLHETLRQDVRLVNMDPASLVAKYRR